MISWKEHRRPLAFVMGIFMLLLTTTVVLPALSTPANAAPTDPVEITLDEITPEYLGEGDELTFSGEITNNTDEPLTSVTVWWRMRTPVLSEETFSKWFDEDEDLAPLTLARHDLSSEIEPGRTQGYEMVIPVENSPFDYGSEIGARGIELVVTATDGDGERARDHVRSTIIWYPHPDSPATPVSVAVPLTPTESEWLEALSAHSPVAEASNQRITGIVEELAGDDVTWGVDASILDSIPASRLADFLPPDDSTDEGEEDEDQDQPATRGPFEWPLSSHAVENAAVVANHTGSRPVISLGWAAPDHGTLMRAGADGEQLRQRNERYASGLLHDARLSTADGVIWSFTPLAPGSASRLDDAVTTAILPPTETGAEFVPPTSHHLTLRSPDQELVDLLLEASSPTELRARSLLFAEEKSQLLITLPPDITSEDARRVAENLRVLRSAPWVELAPPAPPAESDFSLVSPFPAGSATSRTDLSELNQSLSRVDSLAQITEDPDRFIAMFDAAAFLALSCVWEAETTVPDALLTEVNREANAEFLEIEQPSTVNLISQGGELPIGVENSSPIPLTPTVVVQPEDARLLAEEPVESTLEPGQSSAVRVPITAVANGNVTATIRLLDPQGTDVAAPQTFTVRVRADWETTGTAVIAAIVAVGFLFGLIRNFRSASGRHGREQHG